MHANVFQKLAFLNNIYISFKTTVILNFLYFIRFHCHLKFQLALVIAMCVFLLFTAVAYQYISGDAGVWMDTCVPY